MRHYKIKPLSGCCLAAICLLSPQAQAQSIAKSELAISMVITSECQIGTVNDLSFGQTTGQSTPIDQTASFDVRCSAETPFTVGIDQGSTANATQRYLTGLNTSLQVPYQLFRDEARTQTWGNDAETRLSASGTGSNQAIMVYGRVPDLASAMPDTYTDNVTLSVAY